MENYESYDDTDMQEYLARQSSEKPSDALRSRLRRDTSYVVRQYRRRRIAIRAAALAASYLLGIVTLWRPSPPTRPIEIAQQDAVIAEPAVEAAVATPPSPSIDVPTPVPALVAEKSPTTLEYLAARSRSTDRAKLYRRAGDRYLELDPNDIESALRCYSEMFRATGYDPMEPVQPNDNWLLVALKEDKRKERNRASVTN